MDLSPDDADLLSKLHQAGVIDMPGLDLADDDPAEVEWTWEELRRFLRFQRRRKLAESSTELYISCLQFLENPRESNRPRDVPPPPAMCLRPPREQDWLNVVEHYLAHGKDGNTLNNHRLALSALLEFLDVPRWGSLESSFEHAEPNRQLPPDRLVPEFWTRRDLHTDDYLAATFRAIFHLHFHAGLRAPSELADLELGKVDWQNDRLTFWEQKKSRWRYDVQFWPYVISAPNGPTLRWYVDHVRPLVDTGASGALFLDRHGETWGHNQLRKALGRAGSKVWGGYYPYCARHWFAVQFLLANDMNVYPTAKRLGDTVAVVEKHYLDHPKAQAGLDEEYRMPRTRGGPR